MTKERGGSLVFLAAGVYGLVLSSRLPMGRWNEPGPGVFPIALSCLLCLLGALWFFRGKQEKKGPTRPANFLRKLTTPFKITVVTAAFVLFLQPLGYLLASTLYLWVLFFWVSRYSLLTATILSLAFGPGSWLFFNKLLSTPLPGGLLTL